MSHLYLLLVLAAPGQDPAARFRELNPGYVERAGHGYEQSLGPASASLVKAVDLPRFTAAQATAVLKRVIYDFLEAYVQEGGEMSRARHGAVLRRADATMKDLLDDPAAFERWIVWRESTDRVANPLAFLTSPKIALVGLSLVLPEASARDGWTLRVLEDDRQAAAHQACFPVVPLQVLLVEKDRDARLALLVYRDGRAAELLAALEKSARADVRVFWRLGHRFLVFAVETGTVPDDLEERLRRQLATQP